MTLMPDIRHSIPHLPCISREARINRVCSPYFVIFGLLILFLSPNSFAETTTETTVELNNESGLESKAASVTAEQKSAQDASLNTEKTSDQEAAGETISKLETQSEPAPNDQASNDQASDKDKEKDSSLCVFDQSGNDWIDGFRGSAHARLCRTAFWLDSKFGDDHEFVDEDFRGMIALGFRHDEVDGFDPRLRLKVRTKLPNVSNRFNGFIGRVDEDSYVSNTEQNKGQLNAVGLRSNDNQEADWLIGLGYRNPNSRDNGFDYSAGIKLSSGVNPYVKIAHRHLFTPGKKSFIRTTQTAFWRKDEGYGFSSSFDYTKIISDHDILEWDTSAKYSEEQEQWEWITSTSWHHSFTDKRGVSTRTYIRGEEENEVSIPEFGITFTHVKPFLKPWLMLETGIDFRWEKFEEDQNYKSAIRFAVQLEMLLGDYYGKHKRSLK